MSHTEKSVLVTAAGATVAAFHIYAAVAGYGLLAGWPMLETYGFRHFHVGALLALLFLQGTISGSRYGRLSAGSLLALALAATAITLWLGPGLLERSTRPEHLDLITGIVFTLLALEGCRRTGGAPVPVTAILFIAYALFGSYLPQPFGHRAYSLERLVGHLYMSPEGLFGTPVGVSSTLIILFGIYGSVLIASGSAEFFLHFALRVLGRGRKGVVRSITFAAFLLGGPSGSGVATTILIGNASAPLLLRSGLSPSIAGGFLAAAGLGAILSPPVLGSAAFLLAEFLSIGYVDVVRMVIVPTLVYYVSLLAIADGLVPATVTAEPVVDAAARQTWRPSVLHFTAVGSVIGFFLLGYSAELSAVLSTMVALVCWALLPASDFSAKNLALAFAEGARRSIGIAAICACAGLIVGVISLTGLGLKLGGILTYYAGSDLTLATLMSMVVIGVIGLAVPISGSYIICAVIVAPALISFGVPAHVAHMFIFYFAVLSEVSPPTAMAPFAAASITGADPVATTMQAWRFVAPIALLPLVVVLEPSGALLLLSPTAPVGTVDMAIFIASYGLGSIALILALRRPGPLTLGGFAMPFAAAMLLLFPHTLADHLHGDSGIVSVLGAIMLATITIVRFAPRLNKQ